MLILQAENQLRTMPLSYHHRPDTFFPAKDGKYLYCTMKKIIREPDHFEIAAMRTLSKVNSIGSYVNGVTIGPNSTYLESENNETECETSRNSTFVETTLNETNDRDDENKENDFLFSYAAKALREMEYIRQLSVTDNVNEWASKLIHLENELVSKMSENLKLSNEELNIKNKLKSKMLENSIHNEDLVVSQKMSELIKRYMDDKLESEEKSTNEANANKDEEIKLKNERIATLSRVQQEYHDIHKQILDNAMNCKNRSKLISQSDSDFHKIHELTTNLSSVLQKVNLGNVEEQDVETSQIMLQCLSVIADKLKNNADLINFEEEEHQRKAQIQESLSTTVSEVVAVESENLPKSAAENEIDLEKCICKELLEYYSVLCDQLNEFSKRVEKFVSSVPSKSFLRQLKVAIGIPVNAISSTDTAHMRDKFMRISRFLRGDFTLPNTQMPNLPKDSYFVFVVDYLCRNFISHAETRFTLKAPKEAHLLSSLALAIWSEFPEFGLILIANIMKKCPYAIPAYWPRYSDQNDEEYFKSLGYKYKNNELEDELSFTNRMTGIFMFYASLMVTPGKKNRSHPYGIENAWKWIAGLLNLEPRPNFAVVTAELLYVFLETCGYKMSQYYGLQFRKILQVLVDEYIAKIEKITPANFLGPVSRLKLYVVENDVLHKGFREPKGVLSADYCL